MKRKFNWKALLVLVLIVVFALAMVACKDKEPEKTKDSTMEALDALFTALDKTLPKTTADTSVLSASADIAIDTDLVIKTDLGNVALADYIDGLKVSLAANLQENAPEKNVIDAAISLGDKTPIKVFSKGSIAYITESFLSDNSATTPATYMVDVEAIDYTKYLDDLPGILGGALSGLDMAEVKTMLMDLINSVNLGSMLDEIIEAKKTDTGYDLRVILVSEDDDHAGLAGTVGDLLGGILSGLPDSIAPIIDTVVPYVLGAGINDLGVKTKDQVNEVHITFDIDKTSGAVTGLALKVKSGAQVTTTTGGLTLSITNLSLKAEENTALTGKAVPAGAVPLGAEVVVDLDLNNDDLDMKATLQVSPSLGKEDPESGIKLALKSVSLLNGATGDTFDADDLSASYDILEDGQHAIKVDLTALYKAAYGSVPSDVYTTQYYFPINIGGFLKNLASQKYVLVGYNGTGSHGVYEYLWMPSTTKGDAFLADIKTAILADSALLAKIGAAYNVAAPTKADELVVAIADYWNDADKEGAPKTIKYVMAYPAAAQKDIVFKNKAGETITTIKAFVGDDLASIAAAVAAPAIENEIFAGWDGSDDDSLADVLTSVTGAATYTAVYESKDSFVEASVYTYDVATSAYATEGTQAVKLDASNITAADIYGMAFVGWYFETEDETSGVVSSTGTIAQFPANTVAIYPVYKTVATDGTTVITDTVDSRDDSAITALFTKTPVAEANKFALYNFTGKSTDILSLIVGNIGTVLDVLSDMSIDVNTIAGVLRQINDLGIAADATEADAQTQIAKWIRFILSKADGESKYVKNYYYTATAPAEEVTFAKLDGSFNTEDGVGGLEDYMADLVDYTVYQRYIGIYGDLTSEETVDTWQYGWTAADYTAYNGAAGAAAKAAKYVEIEAKAETNAKKGELVVAHYESLALGYISGYLGAGIKTDYATVEEFLFGNAADKAAGNVLTFTIVKEDTKRDATGFNLHIKLHRGEKVYVDLNAHVGLISGDIIDVTTVNPDWNKDGKALDFRAWDMNKIVGLKKNGTAVEWKNWTTEQLNAFATESKVSDGKIVFRGEIYTFEDGTVFQSAAVSALLDLNLEMSGQKTA